MQKSLDFNTQSVKKEIPHSEGFIAQPDCKPDIVRCYILLQVKRDLAYQNKQLANTSPQTVYKSVLYDAALELEVYFLRQLPNKKCESEKLNTTTEQAFAKQRKNHATKKINGESSPQQNQQQEQERRNEERKMKKYLDSNRQTEKIDTTLHSRRQPDCKADLVKSCIIFPSPKEPDLTTTVQYLTACKSSQLMQLLQLSNMPRNREKEIDLVDLHNNISKHVNPIIELLWVPPFGHQILSRHPGSLTSECCETW